MAEGSHLVEFIEDMRRMRAECPWKAEQTHRSLARYLLEESHETLEAIDTGDPEHLREELGDLLLQVYFHAAIAEEAGQFTIDDVAAGLTEKMRRRNPHVFGSAPSDLTAAQVNEQWQQVKADEKQRTSVTDGLPPGLPALLYADKVLDRLSRLDPGVRRDQTEPRTSDDAVVPSAGASDVPGTSDTSATTPSDVRAAEDRVGERLLDLVREARAAGVDPEQALRVAVRREIERSGSD